MQGQTTSTLQSQIAQIQRKAGGCWLVATENTIHKTESNLSVMLDLSEKYEFKFKFLEVF